MQNEKHAENEHKTSRNYRKMKKTLRTIHNLIRFILILIASLLLVYNCYTLIARNIFGVGMPKFFGYAFASVASGSMEPEIRQGDFIVIKEADTYRTGDVITFYDSKSNAYITHRIILSTEDNYATKGDANTSPDDFSVPKAAVVGKVVYVTQGLGGAIDFLQTPIGLLSVLSLSILIWILSDLFVGGIGRKLEK